MKFNLLISLLTVFSVSAQIINKVEGIEINSPCELEYTRNFHNQNNYSCVIQTDMDKIDNYSVTVSNLQIEMNSLNDKDLKLFKEIFLKTIETNSKIRDEETTYLKIKDDVLAVSSISYLTFGNQKFKNISITFIYRKKSFIVNLTTSDINRKNEVNNLLSRIV